MSVADTVRHESSRVLVESYPIVGFNYRMTDIQAAVGRAQLQRLSVIIETRRRLAERYRLLLADIPGIRIPVQPAWARSNWQSFCVWLPHRCDQQRVMQAMLDAGVATRRGIMCAHREPGYHDVPVRLPLPHSEDAQDHCILLPLYPGMTDEEQARVASALRAAAHASGAARVDAATACQPRH